MIQYKSMSGNIVILGAGFGGLRAALDLSRKIPRDWKVILVDRNSYHVYYPRLYEMIVPRSQVSGARCQVSIAEILKGSRVEFIQGEVKGLDCQGRAVQMVDGTKLMYEYLVLALGAGTDYFGIDGLEKYACTLKSVEDAACIREKVGEFLKYTDTEALPPERRRQGLPFSIVIGGAGATGVEVAAELAYLFRNIPRERWSVTLVEALSSVLWMFPLGISQYAHKRLEALGVHPMLDTCIKRVENKGEYPEVVLAPRPLKPGETEAQLACDFLPEHEKRIKADLLLWAGGIRANPLLAACSMAVDRKGRVEVDEYLRVKGLENVFALGDNASLVNPATNQPVPATAQAAIEQGTLVAGNIARLIKTGGLASGSPEARPLVSYTFHNFPAIIPLANRDGVALMGDRVLRGFPAWLLRQAADFKYFSMILPGRRRMGRILSWFVDLFLTNV